MASFDFFKTKFSSTSFAGTMAITQLLQAFAKQATLTALMEPLIFW